ncbi:hypothetical protein IE4872_PC00293 (plasmid) [Rhizobium gallicum]|uniref:Uncharacterized protein n=1 Tax=Rhizobium gallicum TaxID=56730 RepID=A0A1L5NQY5_9HYPH|nr:hypothetical protein IE4872_PC00293 [Rhizobium gallicum]
MTFRACQKSIFFGAASRGADGCDGALLPRITLDRFRPSTADTKLLSLATREIQKSCQLRTETRKVFPYLFNGLVRLHQQAGRTILCRGFDKLGSAASSCVPINRRSEAFERLGRWLARDLEAGASGRASGGLFAAGINIQKAEKSPHEEQPRMTRIVGVINYGSVHVGSDSARPSGDDAVGEEHRDRDRIRAMPDRVAGTTRQLQDSSFASLRFD